MSDLPRLPRSSLSVQDHIVLCGGLGSSPYVRSELEARLTGNSNPNVHPRAQRLTVTVSHDP